MSDLPPSSEDASSEIWPFLVTLFGAVAITQAANQLKRRHYLSAAGTRKACHITVGVVYMLTWANYSDDNAWARYMAASVVAASCFQVLLVGLGIVRDSNLVDGMSRHGAASELLRGPLLYGAVSAIWTVVGWRTSPSAIVGLQALYLGDGLAGLVGGLASEQWPQMAATLWWNKDKELDNLTVPLAASLTMAALMA